MPGRLRRIDGLQLRLALRVGITRVEAATGLLNRINVYPVADGDTGTNLAMTLSAVDEVLAGCTSRVAGEVLALAADAALDGARGNSGAILAAFLQGLADATAGARRIDAVQLAAAFANADHLARAALEAPEEGTILSAISATARALADAAGDRHADLRVILPAVLAATREAVAHGPDLLPVLRRAGVEDAGARGYLLLLEGAVDAALRRPVAAAPIDAGRTQAVPAPWPVEETPGAYRYCTECVISGTGIDRQRLREALAALGDSLVVAGSRDKLRIHIHSDTPAVVFALAARHGLVTRQKADDMGRQAQVLGKQRQQVVVVTDTGADLPEDVLDELGIHTVPLRLHFGERSYLDKLGMTPAEFLREVATSSVHPKTSQPAPGDLRRSYDFLASHYGHVLSLTLLGRVSGTLQASRMAAQRSSDAARITVIDSRNLSVGQGLIVMYAAECARAQLPLPVILAAVERAAATTRLWATVADLDYAIRGGRLPRLAAWLATVLPVLPVLRIGGGRIGIAGLLRRGGDPVPALLRQVLRHAHHSRRYCFAIAHAGCPEQAARLRAALAAAWPGADAIHLVELGPAASVHAGPGALGVAALEYQPPESLRPPA